jgi:hypothetical protein
LPRPVGGTFRPLQIDDMAPQRRRLDAAEHRIQQARRARAGSGAASASRFPTVSTWRRLSYSPVTHSSSVTSSPSKPTRRVRRSAVGPEAACDAGTAASEEPTKERGGALGCHAALAGAQRDWC